MAMRERASNEETPELLSLVLGRLQTHGCRHDCNATRARIILHLFRERYTRTHVFLVVIRGSGNKQSGRIRGIVKGSAAVRPRSGPSRWRARSADQNPPLIMRQLMILSWISRRRTESLRQRTTWNA